MEELKNYVMGKGKYHSRTGHEDTGGEYDYSSALSLTSSLDWFSGQRQVLAALPPRKRVHVSFTGCWLRHSAGLEGCGNFAP